LKKFLSRRWVENDMNILTVKSDWSEVYSVEEVKANLWTEEVFPELKTGTTFYRTGGGGETTGFFVKVSENPEDAWCCGVYRVRRALYQSWKWELLKNKTLEYEPADEKNGRVARCRLVEQIDASATRKIVDDHTLWGNAIEIVKNLRDGLDPLRDASYKDLCLRGILYHFQALDNHLGLLPADSCPSYKEVLHSLKSDEDSESEDSESEEEKVAVCPSTGQVFIMTGNTIYPAKPVYDEEDNVKYVKKEEDSESEEESEDSSDSDNDSLWNEIPDYVWDYTNAEWISELYKIREDKKKSVTERVELMMARIAFFDDEIASRQVAEDEQRERDEEQE
jgi:hypothetical protein